MSLIALIGSKVLSDQELREKLISVGKKGVISLGKYLDTDNDGDIDGKDIEHILLYIEILSSLLGHAAQADGIIHEDEEDKFYNLMNELVFSDEGVLPEIVLKEAQIKKKTIKKLIADKFENPLSLKKIAKYSEENETEEIFYEYACSVVDADKEVNEDELTFLDEFAGCLDITSSDKKRIERKFLKTYDISKLSTNNV